LSIQFYKMEYNMFVRLFFTGWFPASFNFIGQLDEPPLMDRTLTRLA